MGKLLASLAILLGCSWLACAEDAPPGEPVDSSLTAPPAGIIASPEPVCPGRIWFDAEYLLWWVKNGPLPGPMVTSGSEDPIPAPGLAILGQPGTVELYGDGGVNYRGHTGFRLTAGFWFDQAGTIGLEAEGFGLETHTTHYGRNSDRSLGVPVIARPFFNTLTGQEDAQIITAPNTYIGGIDLFSDSRLWGGELNLVGNLVREPSYKLDCLGGFRYLGLDENIRISQSSTRQVLGVSAYFGQIIGPGTFPPFPPDIVSITDLFETRNEFFGGQVGVRGEYQLGHFVLGGFTKIGLGCTHQWSNITGDTQLTDPSGKTLTGPGGLYALASNSGLQGRQRLTLVTEVGARLGFEVIKGVKTHIGYDFLYWDDVARPGAQMNRNLDPRQIPSNPAYGTPDTPARPVRQFNSSDYWAQGLTFGLELEF